MTAEIKKRRFAEGVQVTAPINLNVGGSGGGGGVTNLNENPNADIAVDNSGTNDVGDYIEVGGTGVTVERTTTEADIPLWGPFETGVKLTFATGTADYVRLRFRVPPGARNRKVTYFHYQLPDSYVTQTANIEIYNYSDAYSTGET